MPSRLLGVFRQILGRLKLSFPKSLSISAAKRRRRMARRGRPVVEHFAPDEVLYRRFAKGQFANGLLVPAAFKFPEKDQNTGQSVNRGLFSQAEDALWQGGVPSDLGVLQFPVSCLPGNLECPDTHRHFRFFPKHVPLEDNYAHSEIWCDDIPAGDGHYVVPTKLVKKALKTIIAQNSRVSIEPRA